jgi:hypothetical protein
MRPNPSLSGQYEPGALVRSTERRGDKTVSLNRPTIVRWAPDCFPGIVLRRQEFPLPEIRGTSSGHLTLDTASTKFFLPQLNLGRRSASDVTLRLGKPQIITVASGQLSGQFSEMCVNTLNLALASGDRLDSFGVIVETVVATGLEFRVNWSDNVSGAARQDTRRHLENVIQSLAPAQQTSLRSSIKALGSDTQSSILQTTEEVVLGYRVRPLFEIREMQTPTVHRSGAP